MNPHCETKFLYWNCQKVGYQDWLGQAVVGTATGTAKEVQNMMKTKIPTEMECDASITINTSAVYEGPFHQKKTGQCN